MALNIKNISPDFLKDINILLVEDNELNQLLAVKVFEKWDKKIDIANNGVEAIEKISTNFYDIILMDIQMPGMDGIELTRYIRSSMGEKSNIPIIALTAHATKGEERRCFENGVNDYLSKPYNFEELLNKLYHNLKNNTVNSVLFMESQQKEIASEKLIDFKYLKDFSDGDDTFVKNMISLFLNNTPETMQIILESNKNDDIKILKDEIHKLKSSLSILGMIKASNCVEVIEMEIEKNPLGQKRKDEVNNLNEICQLAIKELELTDEF